MQGIKKHRGTVDCCCWNESSFYSTDQEGTSTRIGMNKSLTSQKDFTRMYMGKVLQLSPRNNELPGIPLTGAMHLALCFLSWGLQVQWDHYELDKGFHNQVLWVNYSFSGVWWVCLKFQLALCQPFDVLVQSLQFYCPAHSNLNALVICHVVQMMKAMALTMSVNAP